MKQNGHCVVRIFFITVSSCVFCTAPHILWRVRSFCIEESLMIHVSSMVKCEYPGCGVWYGRHPLNKYCSKHTQLLLQVARRSIPNPVPIPAPPRPSGTSPSPPPTSPSAPSSGGGTSETVTPPKGRVRHGHRKQVETLKRKIAKRARKT